MPSPVPAFSCGDGLESGKSSDSISARRAPETIASAQLAAVLDRRRAEWAERDPRGRTDVYPYGLDGLRIPLVRVDQAVQLVPEPFGRSSIPVVPVNQNLGGAPVAELQALRRRRPTYCKELFRGLDGVIPAPPGIRAAAFVADASRSPAGDAFRHFVQHGGGYVEPRAAYDAGQSRHDLGNPVRRRVEGPEVADGRLFHPLALVGEQVHGHRNDHQQATDRRQAQPRGSGPAGSARSSFGTPFIRHRSPRSACSGAARSRWFRQDAPRTASSGSTAPLYVACCAASPAAAPAAGRRPGRRPGHPRFRPQALHDHQGQGRQVAGGRHGRHIPCSHQRAAHHQNLCGTAGAAAGRATPRAIRTAGPESFKVRRP